MKPTLERRRARFYLRRAQHGSTFQCGLAAHCRPVRVLALSVVDRFRFAGLRNRRSSTLRHLPRPGSDLVAYGTPSAWESWFGIYLARRSRVKNGSSAATRRASAECPCPRVHPATNQRN